MATIDNSSTICSVTSGNDTIYSNSSVGSGSGSTYKFASGDGNDVVVSLTSGDSMTLKNAKGKTVNITDGTLAVPSVFTNGDDYYENSVSEEVLDALAGNDTIQNSGSNVTIDGGTGSDSIANYGARASIFSGNGDDNIWNVGSAVTIGGGAGSDTIYNDSYGSNTSISGGDGNDKIDNRGPNSTISGGEGDDTVYNSDYDGNYTSISGGAGNDLIENYGSYVTINGGTGNDTVYNNWNFNRASPYANTGWGSNVVFEYGSGDGNDVIYGLGENNTLHITSGSISNVSFSGSDVILTIGTGKITLKDMQAQNFKLKLGNGVAQDTVINNLNIVGTAGADTITNALDGATISALAGNDVVENSGSNVVIDGGAGNDSISNKSLGVISYVEDETVSSYAADSVSVYGGAGNDTILDCGGDNLYLDGGADNDYISGFFRNKTTVRGGDGNDTIISGASSSPSIDGGAGADFISIAGYNTTITGGDGNDTINLGEEQRYTIYGTSTGEISADGGAGNDVINIGIFNSEILTVRAGTGNDTINILSNGYNDPSIASVLEYAEGDGNDVIYGVRENTTLHITSGSISAYSVSGADVILTVGTGTITLKDAANQIFHQKFGNNGTFTVRYAGAPNLSITGTADADTISNPYANATINALAGDDTITNGGSGVIIYAGVGNDFISNTTYIPRGEDVTAGSPYSETFVEYPYTAAYSENANSNTIIGGAGDDFVSLVGSSENLIQYAQGDGHDTIDGLGSSDTLEITSGSLRSASVSGNDVVLNIGSGSITLKDRKGSAFNFKVGGALITKEVTGMENYEDGAILEGTSDSDEIENEASNATIYGDAGDDYINSSGNENVIDGGDGSDQINSTGDSNTVDGGADNDEIYVDGYNNSINGGDGDDIISFEGDENTIYGGAGADNIIAEYVNNSEIHLGDEEDSDEGGNSVEIAGNNNVIYGASSGNDEISLGEGSANNTIISSGGFVHVEGEENYVEVNGYEASIEISGDNNVVSADTEESLTINVSGTGNTIGGGFGSDEIVNYDSASDGNVYRYTGGDDTVSGFHANDSIDSDYPIDAQNITYEDNVVTISFEEGGSLTLVVDGELDASEDTSSPFIYIANGDAIEIVQNYIAGSEDDDYIENDREGVTIDALGGNDTIDNTGFNVSINAGAGDDVVRLTGDVDGATITGGAGNDTIYNDENDGGNLFQYNSGDGNDVIYYLTSNDTLQISTSNYTTAVSGSDAVINVGRGSITIKDGVGQEFYLQIGDDEPEVFVVEEPTNIVLTAGNDTYTNRRDEIVISALGGNDTITNSGSFVSISGGAGADSLVNSGLDSTLQGDAGNDVIYNNDGDNSYLDGGDGNDSINGYDNDFVTALGGAGNDTITGSFNNSYVDGGSGTDLIRVSAIASEIYGGADADSISVSGTGNFISGDAGDDRITVTGGENTISGGRGNDTLHVESEGNVYQYAEGDGNDVIYGFTENDILEITEGDISNASLDGSDGILTIGTGKVTIKDAYGKELQLIVGGEMFATVIPRFPLDLTAKADNETFSENGATVYALAGNDTVTFTGSGGYLDGGAGNDVLTSSGENNTLVGGAGNDTIYVNDNGTLIQYGSGHGKDVIVGFGETDSIEITSGNITKIAQVGSNANITINTGTSNVITIKDFSAKNLKQEDNFIVYNENPYPVYLTDNKDTQVFRDEGATVYALGDNDSILNEGDNSYIDGGAGNDTLVNTGSNVTLAGGEGNDVISLGSHAEGNTIVYTGGNDTVYGFEGDDTLQIGSGSFNTVKNGNDIVISYDDGSVSLRGAANLESFVVDADGTPVIVTIPAYPMTLTGSADNRTFDDEGATVYAVNGNDTIRNEGDNSYIDGGAGADRLFNSGNNVTLAGGAGNDLLVSDGYENLLDAGAGNDTVSLEAEAESTTIIGGAGSDTIYLNDVGNLIQYAAGDGKDAVFGFGENDTIEITGGSVTNVSQSGANVLVTIGSGNANVITLRDVERKYLVFEGNTITFDPDPIPVPTTGNDELTYEKSGITVDALAGDDTVTSSGDSASIYGNTGNDVLISSGNDSTLDGGAGNDVISLSSSASGNVIVNGSGADTVYTNGKGNVIQYSGGKDVIYGFGSSDTIQIDGTISRSVQSGEDVVIYVGNGTNNSITIKDKELSKVMNRNGDVVENPYPLNLTSKADYETFSDEGATVYALGGNDVIENTGANSYIDGGANNDLLINSGENVTLVGGDGVDTLRSSASNSSLSGGAGNDIISLGAAAEGVTMAGGAGNDSIYTNALGNVIQYGSGQGKDTIIGWGEGDSIEITAGTVRTSVQSGKNAIFYLGTSGTSNAVIVANASIGNFEIVNNFIVNRQEPENPVTLAATADNESYTLPGMSVYANGGNDTITTSGEGSSVRGGAGNDWLINSGDNVTLEGEAGNDTIISSGNDGVLDGGAGADRISLEGSAEGTTITGGAGNDTIYLNGEANWIQYGTGDGKDTIFGFDENASIQLTNGSVKNIATVKGGVNVTVGSSANVITLRDAELKYVQVTDDNMIVYNTDVSEFPVSLTAGPDKETYSGDGDVPPTVYALAGNDTIVLEGNDGYVDGGAGNDKLSLGAGAYNNTLYGGAGNDSIYLNGEANWIQYGTGDGKDTIFGFDENASIQLTSGSVKNIATVKGGVNVTVGSSANVITLRDAELKYVQLTEDNVIIYNTDVSEFPTTLTGAGDKVSYGADIKPTVDAAGGADSIVVEGNEASILGNAGNDTLISSGNDGVFDGGAGNDKISLGADALNNTLIGGAGADTIYTNGKGNVIQYGSGQGKDIVVGFGGDDSIEVTAGSIRTPIQSGKNAIIYVGTGTNNGVVLNDVNIAKLAVVNNFVVYTETVVAAITLSPNADNETYSNDGVSVDANSGNDTITTSGNESSVYGNAGNDVLINSGDNVTLTGGAGNDTIISSGSDGYLDGGSGTDVIRLEDNASNNMIIGGAGNDTISLEGDASNNTIIGGAGTDKIYTNGAGNVIQYGTGDGKDTIYGFGGDDSIQITSGSVSKISVSGSKYLVTIGSGSTNVLTLTDVNVGSNASIGTVEGGGLATVKAVEPPKFPQVPTVLSGGIDKYTFAYSKASLDASGGDDVIEFTGNENSVKGGVGNDKLTNIGSSSTLFGDAGSDTLIADGNNNYLDGGAGADVISLEGESSGNTIIGGAGNDKIYTNGLNNLIQYGSGDGKDTIFGFGEDDTIQITSGEVRTYNESNGNTVFYIGSGTNNAITIKDARPSQFVVDDNMIVYNPNKYPMTLTAKNDTEVITDQDATVDAAGGNDKITISGANSSIYGNDGNDTLVSTSNSVTLEGGAGADRISVDAEVADNMLIGGAGNDTIYTNGAGNLIQYAAGAGKDSIVGFGGSDSIEITDGEITKIAKSGTGVGVTINGSSSNVIVIANVSVDSIYAEDNVILYGAPSLEETLTTGADSETYERDNVSVWAIAGNDTIETSGKDAYFNLGAGNDRIENSGNGVTVEGEAGSDTIISSGNDGVLNGGAANDSIVMNGEATGNTLIGGTGNDTIQLNDGANLIQYASGDGNDVVIGFGENSSIEVTSGSVKVSQSGANVIVAVGSTAKAITLKDTPFSDVKLEGSIVAYNTDTVVYLSDKADSEDISTVGAIVDAMGGADKLTLSGSEISIYGGAGNDVITVGEGSEDNTINGGAGADTVYSNGGHNWIQHEAGKDVIVGWSVYDTIEITSGEVTDSMKGSNGDIIVYVGGTSNAITIRSDEIKDVDDLLVEDGNLIIAKDIPTVIYGTDASDNMKYGLRRATLVALKGNDVITNSGEDVSIVAGDGNDIITNTGNNVIIEGGAGNDRIIIEGESNDNTIIGGAGADTIETNGQSNLMQFASGDGKNVVVGFNGSDSIEITSGSIKNSVVGSSDITFNLNSSGSIVLKDVAGDRENILVVDNQYIIYDSTEVVIIPLSDSADSIEISDSNVVVQALKGNDKVTVTGSDVTLDGGAGKDTLIATGNDVSIFGGADADRISISSSSENITINGGAGADTIYTNGNGNYIEYASGDGKDTIHGFGGKDSIKVDGEVKMIQSGANVLITVGGASSDVITLKDVQRSALTVEDDTIFIGGIVPYTLTSGADNQSFTEDNATIYALGGNDTITIEGSQNLIDAGAGADKIFIEGEANNTTVIGGKGNDVVTNNGNTLVYQYASGDGNDVINNFGENSVFQITSGEVSEYSKDGDDAIVKIGSSKVTLGGAGNSVVNFVDENEEEYIFDFSTLRGGLPAGASINASGSIITLTRNYTGSTFNVNNYAGTDAVTRINATAVTQDLTIIGNDNENDILAGSGNTTMSGGKGDDTYTGGDGEDVFIYTAGNDVIKGYTEELDTIQLVRGVTIRDNYVSGANYVFETNKGALTVNGGREFSITVLDYNGDEIGTYGGSNGNLAVPEDEFFADDNFIGGGVQIADVSEITAVNYSVGKVETGTVELAQDTLSAALAYGQDK